MATEAEEALIRWCLSHQADLQYISEALELADAVRNERVDPEALAYLKPFYAAIKGASCACREARQRAVEMFGPERARSAYNHLSGDT